MRIARTILMGGYAVHGSSYRDERMMVVLESRAFSFQAPPLGYGEGNRAEEAFARACYTFEQFKQESIHPNDQIEAKKGRITPSLNRESRFDLVVAQSPFVLSQEGRWVVASSGKGGGIAGEEPLEVAGSDPIAAIEELADSFNFYEMDSDYIESLPTTSFTG